ncbi:juvenile hormone epoxide hydrolase-like [Zerene cesonia]|uniref:juvenile hormone epoxide hydrolase-like n=1 Tax=Zerene cesonia TaxID=33412 RepID=UPI0018E50FB4|nr:juvenile hormone epoxide hydrolase-like [Zerene cesonia]
MAPKKKNKVNVKNKNEKIKEKSNNYIWLLVVSAAVVLLAVLSFRLYIKLSTVPELPKVDLNVWWGPNTTNPDTSIRKYRILFSDSMQENLRRKFETFRRATRLKSLEETAAYGINSYVLAQIFAHWQFKYKYTERVRYFNRYEHFRTNIQGLDVHYVHVKPNVGNNVKVLPLLLLHGFPGSIKDFYEVIPILTTPRVGYDFVFEVIVPSLPGFAFSQGAVRPGLTAYQMAIVLRNLMERIGIKQFYLQAGDYGHNIGSHLATLFPNQVLGYHTNNPINLSGSASVVWVVGSIWPTLVAKEFADRLYPLREKLAYYLEEFGFKHIQGTKPDTLGVALQDSPLGLAAYIIDRILLFTDPANKYKEDGGLPSFNSTDLIDNVMLYWSTGSITTALRFFKEMYLNNEMEDKLARISTTVPTWGLRAKHELTHSPDFVLRWKFPNLVGTTNLDDGGHYLAFEKPEVLSNDVFRAVKRFLELKKNK